MSCCPNYEVLQKIFALPNHWPDNAEILVSEIVDISRDSFYTTCPCDELKRALQKAREILAHHGITFEDEVWDSLGKLPLEQK